MENALKQLDILDCPEVGTMTDSGYSAEGNMTTMIKNICPFIMHVPTDTKWTQPLMSKRMDIGEIIHCDPKFPEVTVMQIHDYAYERQRDSKKSGLEKGIQRSFPDTYMFTSISAR